MKRFCRASAFLAIFTFAFAGQLVYSEQTANAPRLEPDPLAYTIAANFDPFDWRSLFELAYWASGEPDREAAVASFEPVINELTGLVTSMDDRTKGEAVLEYMHERFLKSYSEKQSRFDTLLSTGRYNCLSSALLYAIMGTAVGLEVAGVSVPDHAFCSVRIEDRLIDVETTNPFGFDPGTKTEFQDGFGKTTGFSYVPPGNYRSRTSIDILTLFSLLLQNRIADAEASRRFDEAVGIAVDRWILLGGGPGLEFEDMVVRMLNYGVMLSRAGLEDDALLWALQAISVYGPHPKWDDFTDGVVNNLLVKLMRRGQLDEARSRLDLIKPRLTSESAVAMELMISDAELVAALKAAKAGGPENEFLAAFNKIRLRGVVSDDRLKEIDVSWRLYKIDIIAKENGWSAAYEATQAAISEVGSNYYLEKNLRIYRANHKAELYNAAAEAFNNRRYEEAKYLIQEAIIEFPDESVFRTLLMNTERAISLN